MPQKFDILTRKNLGDAAIVKRADKLALVATVVGGDYAMEWIKKNGKQDNVYYVSNFDTKKIVQKYVWNKNQLWHLTKYEQSLNKNKTVNDKRTSMWFSGNQNKK